MEKRIAKNRGDRFIPYMSKEDTEALHEALVREERWGMAKMEEDNVNNPRDTAYDSALASAVGIPPQRGSYMRYRPSRSPPSILERYLGKEDLFSSVYTSAARQGLSTGLRRSYNITLEDSYDCPHVVDDFYYSTMDWSPNNILCTALEDEIYARNMALAHDVETDPLFNWTDRHAIVNYMIIISAVCCTGCPPSRFIIGTTLGELAVCDFEHAQNIDVSYKIHTYTITCIACNGAMLCASGGNDAVVCLNDMRMGNVSIKLRGHTGIICNLQYDLHDTTKLASTDNNGTVKIWDVRQTFQSVHTMKEHAGGSKALAWCPWESSILITGGGNKDGQIKVWNTTNGTCIRTVKTTTTTQFTSLRWSLHPSIREFISTGGVTKMGQESTEYTEGTLALWNYDTMEMCTKTDDAHSDRVLQSALNPTGTTVATLAADETLKLWNVWTNEEIAKVEEAKQRAEDNSHSLRYQLIR